MLIYGLYIWRHKESTGVMMSVKRLLKISKRKWCRLVSNRFHLSSQRSLAIFSKVQVGISSREPSIFPRGVLQLITNYLDAGLHHQEQGSGSLQQTLHHLYKNSDNRLIVHYSEIIYLRPYDKYMVSDTVYQL